MAAPGPPAEVMRLSDLSGHTELHLLRSNEDTEHRFVPFRVMAGGGGEEALAQVDTIQADKAVIAEGSACMSVSFYLRSAASQRNLAQLDYKRTCCIQSTEVKDVSDGGAHRPVGEVKTCCGKGSILTAPSSTETGSVSQKELSAAVGGSRGSAGVLAGKVQPAYCVRQGSCPEKSPMTGEETLLLLAAAVHLSMGRDK